IYTRSTACLRPLPRAATGRPMTAVRTDCAPAREGRAKRETRRARCRAGRVPQKTVRRLSMILVRRSPSTGRSALSSTDSACARPLATTHAVSSARCQRAWCPASATATLNRLCSRSLRLRTTLRFSFSDWQPKTSSSQVITPITTSRRPFRGWPRGRLRALAAAGGARQRAGDLLDPIRLDQVPDLDVVVARDVEPALEAFPDFADIVLEPLQAAQLALVDLHAVAHDPHAAPTVDDALGDVAPRHGPDPGHAEELPDLGHAEEHLALLRLEHPFHRGLHILDRLVDDVVEADVDALPLGGRTRLRRRPHVEADDDRARRRREEDVRLVDRADPAVHDLDGDLRRRELRSEEHTSELQ